jgi:bla regulator protein blaR1
MTPRARLSSTLLFLALLGPLTGQFAIALEAAPPPSLPNLSYDVVSIRPSKAAEPAMNISKNRFVARGVPAWMLIFNAYSLRPTSDLPGLPGWAKSENYDFEATMDEATATAFDKVPRDLQGDVFQAMLQKVLADRLKLKMHTEMREQPLYTLVVSKSGAKLKPSAHPEAHGTMQWQAGKIQLVNGEIDNMLYALSDALGRDVVNKTGLTAHYDIDLKWTPDEAQALPDAGPTLLTAIEEQLGLKLEASRGPVKTYVVDHIEHPEPN